MVRNLWLYALYYDLLNVLHTIEGDVFVVLAVSTLLLWHYTLLQHQDRL